MKRLGASAKGRSYTLLKLLKKLMLVLIVLVLIIAIVVASSIGILKYQGKKSILSDCANKQYEEIIEYDGKKYKYNTNIFSVAFLGIDQDELKTSDETDFVGASDTMIILTVDLSTGIVKAIALPRETMVEMDTFYDGTDEIRLEETHQLYLAYSYGDGRELSCQNALTAISRVLMNVPIDKYYALNLNGLKAINDSIGGVLLKAKQDFPDYDIKSGEVVTLKGDAAETYVRSRPLTAEGSLERLDRQVHYVESFISQVAPAVMTDFTTVARLYNEGADHSQSNLTLANLTYLASIITSKGSVNFQTYTIDGKMKTYQDKKDENSLHAAFYPDEKSIMQTILDVFYTRIG